MTEAKQPQLPAEARIQLALKKARQRAYRMHRAFNVPVVVMKDGKIVNKVPDDADIEAGCIR